jgi:hypothetical protein
VHHRPRTAPARRHQRHACVRHRGAAGAPVAGLLRPAGGQDADPRHAGPVPARPAARRRRDGPGLRRPRRGGTVDIFEARCVAALVSEQLACPGAVGRMGRVGVAGAEVPGRRRRGRAARKPRPRRRRPAARTTVPGPRRAALRRSRRRASRGRPAPASPAPAGRPSPQSGPLPTAAAGPPGGCPRPPVPAAARAHRRGGCRPPGPRPPALAGREQPHPLPAGPPTCCARLACPTTPIGEAARNLWRLR